MIADDIIANAHLRWAARYTVKSRVYRVWNRSHGRAAILIPIRGAEIAGRRNAFSMFLCENKGDTERRAANS